MTDAQQWTDSYIDEVQNDGVKEVLGFIMNKDESQRPTAQQVAAHNFFATNRASSPHAVYGPPISPVAPVKTFRQLGNTNEVVIKEMEAQGYYIKSLIGQGGYGYVYSGAKRNPDGTDTPMALKVIGGLYKRKHYREHK